MIKIDIYKNVENAKKVYKAYYHMICGSVIMFPDRIVADAVSNHFFQEYSERLDLGLTSGETRGPDEPVINRIKIIVKRHPSLYTFLFSENSGDLKIAALGQLLCGYMDEPELQELRNKYNNRNHIINTRNNDEDNELLKKVFCYERINSKTNQDKAYDFVSSLNLQACPYCNRNYVGVIKAANKDGFKHRPQLDHFYSKSHYPFLAVSMKNLVPSCSTCNLAKNNLDTEILYPYREGLDESFIFSIMTENNISYITDPDNTQFRLALIENKINNKNKKTSIKDDKEYRKKIKNSSKIFGWEEQYSLSKKYALRVLQNSYLYNRVYQEDIRKALPDIFKSKEDIKQIINPKLREIDEFNEEPLSKLTKDIFDWGILLNEDN